MLLSSDAEDVADALARLCALRTEDVQLLQRMCHTHNADETRDRHYFAHVACEFAQRERWRCARERDAVQRLTAWQHAHAVACGDVTGCAVADDDDDNDKGGGHCSTHAACQSTAAAAVLRERAHVAWWLQLGAYATTCSAQLCRVHELCADDLSSSPFATLTASRCLYATTGKRDDRVVRLHGVFFAATTATTTAATAAVVTHDDNTADDGNDDDASANVTTVSGVVRNDDSHACAPASLSALAQLQRWRKWWRVLLFLYTQARLSLCCCSSNDDDDDATLRRALHALPVCAATQLLQQQRQLLSSQLQHARALAAAAAASAATLSPPS